MSLNAEQIAALLKPIKPSRVMQAQGQSHVPAYDVAAHLTRVLGFGGWDSQILEQRLLFETDVNGDGKRWSVGYSATVKLTIKDPEGNHIASWENGACGDALNQPSRADAHHLAMTTAISTALKRCAAFGLGDQFGLSLYNKGSQQPLIGVTLVKPESSNSVSTDLESHVPIPESVGNDERQEVDSTATVSLASEETQHRIKAALEELTPDDRRDFAQWWEQSGITKGVYNLTIEEGQTVIARLLGILDSYDGFVEDEGDVTPQPKIDPSPAPTETITAPKASPAQIGKIRAMLGKGEDVHARVSDILKKDVSSLNDLTKAEASHVITNLGPSK